MKKRIDAYGRVLDKLNLPEEYDKRRKLTKAQHQAIKDLYKTGDYSYRGLGRMFNTSYGNIQRLVSKTGRLQILEAGKRWRAKNPKKIYNSMDIRRRKRKLFEEGILKLK